MKLNLIITPPVVYSGQKNLHFSSLLDVLLLPSLSKATGLRVSRISRAFDTIVRLNQSFSKDIPGRFANFIRTSNDRDTGGEGGEGSTFHPRDVGWTHRRPDTKPMRCRVDSAKGSQRGAARRGSAICMNFISFARQARKARRCKYICISEDPAAVKIRGRLYDRLPGLEGPGDRPVRLTSA